MIKWWRRIVMFVNACRHGAADEFGPTWPNDDPTYPRQHQNKGTARKSTEA
jgi:hypothetical protein